MKKLVTAAALAALAFTAYAQKEVKTSPIVMTGTGGASAAKEVRTAAIVMTGLGAAEAKEIRTPAITMTGRGGETDKKGARK